MEMMIKTAIGLSKVDNMLRESTPRPAQTNGKEQKVNDERKAQTHTLVSQV
jgi:hypothetical protein